MVQGVMKNTLLMILLLFLMVSLVLLGTRNGYQAGYEQGRKETNTWWIDQKSRVYDTSEVLKKNTTKGYNQI